MSWMAKAPSNLALIKYAGKMPKGLPKGDSYGPTYKDKKLNKLSSQSQGLKYNWCDNNIPLNGSLSYTLDHLITTVRITEIDGPVDKWKALEEKDIAELKQTDFKQGIFLEGEDPSSLKFSLSKEGSQKFLSFFSVLKKVFKIPGFYLIESVNNFPADAGLASSASSFCALTLATHKVALDRSALPKKEVRTYNPTFLSILSQHGSGSSCRSFFKPWAFWEGERAYKLYLPFSKLTHQFIITDKQKKPVSSSVAHEKIVHSSLFKGRVQRAEIRLSYLLSALEKSDWKSCFKITWAEFQDLHQIYESVGIMYQNDKSREVLKKIKKFWDKYEDGPLVTMDAGSVVHLLYRSDQKQLSRHLFSLLQDLN